MFTISKLVLLFAAVTTALMAGLFYAWSISVMPGIARLPDRGFLSAMQEMNRAILNPLFLLCFMGAAILLPVATFMQYSQPVSGRFWLLLLASIAYLAGVMGVTMAGNVPLNNMIDAFQIQSATAQELAKMRQDFEGPWNRLNTIRTLSVTLSVILVIAACLWRDKH
jgi:uncharacterized membrane protein